MNCPLCKADIPSDSWFCDQCGAELMFCPKCNEPRKGKRCTTCGSVLVAGKDLDAAAPMRPGASSCPSCLVRVDDPSQVVNFKDGGIVGRTNGDYVNVFGNCPYVSGTHGKISLHSSNAWAFTDLGSTNGTKINGTPLVPNKMYPLQKGQTIEIGLVKFRIE